MSLRAAAAQWGAIPSGTNSSPGLAFADDADTGFYRSGANEISVALGGTQYMVFSQSYLLSAPSFYTPNGLVIGDGIEAPAAEGGYAKIYVDVADGDLKVKFSDGVTKVIAADT